MHNLSRRAILAGVAAAPALAFPAIAQLTTENAIDWSLALTRVEQVVATLRKSYVCKNWKLDEERAASTLRYFRHMVAIGADGSESPDDGFMESISFLGDHGQSLDWVLLGDIGGLICRAASASRAAGAVQS